MRGEPWGSPRISRALEVFAPRAMGAGALIRATTPRSPHERSDMRGKPRISRALEVLAHRAMGAGALIRATTPRSSHEPPDPRNARPGDRLRDMRGKAPDI